MVKKSKKTPAEAATKIQTIGRGMLGKHIFANKMVASLWSDIYDTTWTAVRLNQVDKMRSTFAADEAIEQMNRVILWATFAYAPDPLHDETPFTRPALSSAHTIDCGLWNAEEQPSTTVIDRHTRFEVTAGPPNKPGSPGGGRRTTTLSPNTSQRNMSPSSTPGGSRSGGVRGRMDSSSASGYFDGTSSTGNFGIEPAVDIRDIADPLERQGRRGKNSISDIEREYFEQMEREKQEKIKREAEEAERAAEAARVKAAWDESMRDVEGKQWTVDAEGKVIVVTPVIGDKMPSRTIPVKYGVKIIDKGGGGDVNNNSKGGRRGSKQSGDRESNKNDNKNNKHHDELNGGITNQGSSSSSKLHFTESYDNQPPLIKTLQPESGVGLIYGNQKKNGRQVSGGDSRMSRSDYFEKTGFTGGSDRSLEDLESMDKNINSKNKNDGFGGSNNNSKNNSRNGGSRISTANSTKSEKEKFPLIDPLKGGRPISSSSSQTSSLYRGSPKSAKKGGDNVSLGDSMMSPTDEPNGNKNNSNNSPTNNNNGKVMYGSYEEEEAAAVAAELELLASLNEDNMSNMKLGEKFDPAPIQRKREQSLQHKPQRDVRNPNLDGPLPTAYRSKLAPPTTVGMSTGHGVIGSGKMNTNINSNQTSSPSHQSQHDNDNDDGNGFEDMSYISSPGGHNGNSSSSHHHGRSPQVIIPQESEDQGLRYQIGIKDSTKQFNKTRPV